MSLSFYRPPGIEKGIEARAGDLRAWTEAGGLAPATGENAQAENLGSEIDVSKGGHDYPAPLYDALVQGPHEERKQEELRDKIAQDDADDRGAAAVEEEQAAERPREETPQEEFLRRAAAGEDWQEKWTHETHRWEPKYALP